jgi:hypothetical protein
MQHELNNLVVFSSRLSSAAFLCFSFHAPLPIFISAKLSGSAPVAFSVALSRRAQSHQS